MPEPWVKRIVDDVMGPPPQVGKYYEHPDDGPIRVTSGQYEGTHGISNFWYWTVLETGETHHGYGGRWPELERHTMDLPTDEMWVVESVRSDYSTILGVCATGRSVEKLTQNIGWRDVNNGKNVLWCDSPSPDMRYRATRVKVER